MFAPVCDDTGKCVRIPLSTYAQRERANRHAEPRIGNAIDTLRKVLEQRFTRESSYTNYPRMHMNSLHDQHDER